MNQTLIFYVGNNGAVRWSNGCVWPTNQIATIRTVNVSAAACGMVCVLSDGCEFFEWNEWSQCRLAKLTQSSTRSNTFSAILPVSASTGLCGFTSTTIGSTAFRPGDNGAVMYSNACDWPNGNFFNVNASAEICGKLCLDVFGCSHFAWSYQTCWFKNSSVSAILSDQPAHYMCGYVTGYHSSNFADSSTTATTNSASTSKTTIKTSTKTKAANTTQIAITATSASTKTKSAVIAQRTMFAGVNSYFLHTLTQISQLEILSALQSAGVTVVRIFITSISAGGKDTDSLGATDLETDTIGFYNDAILSQIDQLIVNVIAHGIKLQITMHDRWSLDGTWNICDAYCKSFVSRSSNLDDFYSGSNAQNAFDARLEHIVTHKNSFLADRAWMDISEGIYSFEIENEAFGSSSITNSDWWCARAQKLRTVIENSTILIGTGGGQDFAASLAIANFECSAIDVIGIHSYDNSISVFKSNLQDAYFLGAQHGKIVIMQEFGATSSKADWISAVANVCNSLNIPWLPWEVSTVSQYSDYEFGTNESQIWTALTDSAASI